MDYYFNLETGQVEAGPQSPSNQRMGPYATREEAARALDIAAARNESWDEDDAAWKGESD